MSKEKPRRMKPLVLKGHDRALTQVKYNREGDLLFSSAKSTQPCVWRSDTGERLGTYKGHNGSVWSFDVNRNSTHLLTGAADSSSKLFDVETGKEIHSWSAKTPVRSVSIAEGERTFLTVTDAVMGKPATIWVYDKSIPNPIREIVNPTSRITSAHWGPLNKHIYSTCEDGSVNVYDPERDEGVVMTTKKHTKNITRMSFSEDQSHFVTASADFTAKLFDTKTLEHLKTFETERPVNASAICPIKDLVLLGGGQSAAEVTTTRVDPSQFKIRFFHKVYQEELALIAGHFGPVNTVAFAPDGSFVSGGEDGYIRVYNLEDPVFFSFGEDDDFEEED